MGLCVLVGLAELGWLVGCGDTVGAVVGLLLGWAEGALEGWDDGTNDGAAEGRRVGPLSAVLNPYEEVGMIVLVLVIVNTVRLKGTFSA